MKNGIMTKWLALVCLFGLLPAFVPDVTAGAEIVRVDFSKGGLFGPWRSPTGAWVAAGSVFKKADQDNRLGWKPGTGAWVNGPTGRTSHFFSRIEHGDVEAHIEFMVPKGSNSGVYFQGRYEIQVFDSWGVEKPKHSDCGGIYQRWKSGKGYEGRPPRVNASKAPGEWQTFDVIFRAPRFDADGKKIADAVFVKVVHNGVVIHENQVLSGPTRASAWGDEKPLGPLMLQGDHGPVAYRNIQLRMPIDDARKQADALMPAATLEALKTLPSGGKRKSIAVLEEALKKAPRDIIRLVETRWLTLLEDAGATLAGKRMTCRLLRQYGTCQSVPVLVKLLGHKKLSHMARFALEALPCPPADAALKDAMAGLKGDLKLGLISTMAARGGCGAEKELAALLEAEDDNMVEAALKALGRIGTPAAAKALAGASVPRFLKALRMDALLQCADRLLQKGKKDQAAAIYKDLDNRLSPVTVRIAAQCGLLKASGKDAVPVVLKMLQDSDPKMQQAAVTLLRDLPGAGVTEAIGKKLPDLPPAIQTGMLDTLAKRNDPAALPAVLGLAQKGPEAVRIAAIKTLGKIGGSSAAVVDFLLATATKSEGAPAQTALTALTHLQGGNVDRSILAALEKAATPAAQSKILDILKNRRTPAALPALLALAKKQDSPLKGKALQVYIATLPALPADQCEDKFKTAMALAGTPEEKRLVLSTLATIPAGWSLAMAEQFRKDGELSEAAEQAFLRIFTALHNKVLVENKAVLKAKQAKVHGSGCAYESGDDRDCIGVWNNQAAWVSWDVIFRKAGKYTVEVSQSMAGSAGSTYTVSVAGQKVAGKVEDTGDWARFVPFKLGTITIEKPGAQQVAVKVTKKLKTYVMNMRSVTLTRVP